LEISAVRSELDRFISSSPLSSGLDLDLHDDKLLPFRRHRPGLPDFVNMPSGALSGRNAVTTMTEAEQNTSKGTPGAQWRAAYFAPTPRSVRDARAFVGSVVTQPAMREKGELLVSELTTNALRHATGPFEVRVRATPRVRVEVRDGSTQRPMVKDIDTIEESGRGLHIVSQLASAWGTEERADGKVVWFEL
jgi:hypothetical protein